MTDTTKNLADAARELLKAQEMMTDYHSLPCKLMDTKYGRVVDLTHLCAVVSTARIGMEIALAAYDAAQVPPSDAEIEAAIDAFGQAVFESGKADGKPRWATDVIAKNDEVSRHHRSLLAIMRRARPDAGLLRAAMIEQLGLLRMIRDGVVMTKTEASLRFENLRAEVARLEGK